MRVREQPKGENEVSIKQLEALADSDGRLEWDARLNDGRTIREWFREYVKAD